MACRRSAATVGALVALLVAVPAAHAATYAVTPGNGPCGGADLVCGNLVEASAAAAAGDTFNISPSATPYDAVEWKVGGLTINGAAGVGVNGTMTFSGIGGGVSKLSKVALSQGAAAAPGIIVNGAAGLELSDSVIASKDGHGIIITASEANKIVRSVVITGGAGAAAVKIESFKESTKKALTVESTILTGGSAGLFAETKCSPIETAAGDVSIVARHLTAAGSTNGIVLDSSAAQRLLAPGVGNITATLADSLALDNKTTRYAVAGGENQATITADTRTLQTGDRGTLFADAPAGNFRLRPGSPAIDKGGFTAGESETDIDGDPRPGPTTDLGADEFVNAAPKAALKVVTATPRSLQPVTFDASGSSDREAKYGGGIVKYQWSFGDGQTQETSTATVQHTYQSEGTAVAQVVVVDNFGAASAPASAEVKLADGLPPDVKIAKPTNNQVLRLFKVVKKTTTGEDGKRTTTTRRRLKLAFSGTAKDTSGVANVVLFVQKLPASGPAPTTGTCTWLDPKKGLIRRSCSKPVFILARLGTDDTWSYSVSSKIKQPSSGRYRVYASGVDKAGAAGNSAKPDQAVHSFRLRR